MKATFWGQYLLKSVRSFDHNILLAGSPRSGKTLLARAVPGILPEMSIEESLDVTRMYSVADQLPAGTPLIKQRPFRAPHHTISHAVWWAEAISQSPAKYLLLKQVFCFWMNSPNSAPGCSK